MAQVTRVLLDRQDQILYDAEVLYRGDWVKGEISRVAKPEVATPALLVGLLRSSGTDLLLSPVDRVGISVG